jgi:hypothetical protein
LSWLWKRASQSFYSWQPRPDQKHPAYRFNRHTWFRPVLSSCSSRTGANVICVLNAASSESPNVLDESLHQGAPLHLFLFLPQRSSISPTLISISQVSYQAVRVRRNTTAFGKFQLWLQE